MTIFIFIIVKKKIFFAFFSNLFLKKDNVLLKEYASKIKEKQKILRRF